MNPLPEKYSPGPKDVICSWARQNHNHAGNKRFRDLIDTAAPAYVKAETKFEKTKVIADLIDLVRRESPDGGFVKKDYYSGRWFDIGSERARDKVGHAIRKAADKLIKVAKAPEKRSFQSGTARNEHASKKRRALPSQYLPTVTTDAIAMNSGDSVRPPMYHQNLNGDTPNARADPIPLQSTYRTAQHQPVNCRGVESRVQNIYVDSQGNRFTRDGSASQHHGAYIPSQPSNGMIWPQQNVASRSASQEGRSSRTNPEFLPQVATTDSFAFRPRYSGRIPEDSQAYLHRSANDGAYPRAQSTVVAIGVLPPVQEQLLSSSSILDPLQVPTATISDQHGPPMVHHYNYPPK